MKRRAFLISLGASLISLRASADSVDDTLAKVSRARAGARTLVGPFTQTATVGLLRSQVVSNGKLYLQYPSRLRWELGPPDSVTYWVAPEGLAYRSAHGSGRVPIDTTQQADVEALRAMLGGDISVLRSRFDVREVPSDTGGPAFECTPKSALRLRKLTFALDADLVRPRKATIVYDNRNKTEIVFGELRRDVPIDPALLVLP
ncbi:MAG TPA: outer membrane lipoprotein carrier protein LolA [Polyangiaceae bacterium]|jgi:outer membrane lipoprotein-sorting protein